MPEDFTFVFRQEDYVQIALARKAVGNTPSVKYKIQSSDFFVLMTDSPTGQADFLKEYYRLADAAEKAKN